MSSPAAPLRSMTVNVTGSVGSPVRGRTMSDIYRSATQEGGAGKRLKKSQPGSGPGVGPRGKTLTNDLADGEIKRRRRSASLDYGDLSVNSRNRQSRAEEWVGLQDKVVHTDGEEEGEGENGVQKSGHGVKRRKSDKRSSLPASASTSNTTLVVPPLPLSTTTSASRGSSIKSATGTSARRGASALSSTPGRTISLSTHTGTGTGPASASSSSTSLHRSHTTQTHSHTHKSRSGSIDMVWVRAFPIHHLRLRLPPLLRSHRTLTTITTLMDPRRRRRKFNGALALLQSPPALE
ncbi:hypothetical protein BT96DRAFT_433688 [Gymnopus androsaceus JB14]|uniref:Uncharacterized protein n=1 Tax=Gymnopus androsaceus JB14 TaxID=1447944 RepID=A0A6A4I138_9AGAR|nr:hypothetical protein BT96DRAFT_433688 [Gymnopus androsaceus JB14]